MAPMFSPAKYIKTKEYNGPQVTYEMFKTPEEAEEFGKKKYKKRFAGVLDLDPEVDMLAELCSDEYLDQLCYYY